MLKKRTKLACILLCLVGAACVILAAEKKMSVAGKVLADVCSKSGIDSISGGAGERRELFHVEDARKAGDDLPHEQRLRDCLGMESADGPREVHLGIIARDIVGREFAPF